MEERINNTWLGIGKLHKLHFVFNLYGMCQKNETMDLVAIYNGNNNSFLVRSDLHCIKFVPSLKEALTHLFVVFAGKSVLETIGFETLRISLLRQVSNANMIHPRFNNVLIRYVSKKRMHLFYIEQEN